MTTISTTTIPAFTLTLTSVTTATTYYPDLGRLLLLHVTLNSSMIRSGAAIKAEITLFNPLGANLPAVPGYPAGPPIQAWNGYDYICGGGQLSTIFGYALFRGHYSLNNLSSAGNPLTLAPPVQPPCPIFLPPFFFIFLPHSNETWAYGLAQRPPLRLPAILNASTSVCRPNPGGGTLCGGTDSLFGYWNATGALPFDNATTSSRFFHYFPPGWYTLVAEAAWGQQVIENFQVKP